MHPTLPLLFGAALVLTPHSPAPVLAPHCYGSFLVEPEPLGWPFERLLITADLEDEDQAEAIEKAIDGLAFIDPRLRLVVVDTAHRDGDELAWRLLELGLHDAPAAFFPTGVLADAPAEATWLLRPSWPDFGNDIGVALPPRPDDLGGALEDVRGLVQAVEDCLETRPEPLEYLLSRSILDLALDLEVERLDKLHAPYAGATNLEGTAAGEAATLQLTLAAIRASLPGLLAEVETAWKSGRPLDAAERLNALESVFGHAADFEGSLARFDFLEDGAVPKGDYKHDKALRKALGKSVPRNLERAVERLRALAADSDAPAPVRARAERWIARIERNG